MAIYTLTISYPDFKLNEIMDPEQFDINNNEIVTKINELVSTVNTHTAVGGVTTANISDGAVTTTKIADKSITLAKIDDTFYATLTDVYSKGQADTIFESRTFKTGSESVYKVLSDNNYSDVEKIKLTGVAESANNYVHPLTHDAGIIVENTSKRFVSDAEKATWNQVTNKVDKITGKQLSTNDYTNTEKTKLAGIAESANNYTHPSTHAASIIIENVYKRFVSDAEKTTWNEVANKVDKITGKQLSTEDYTTAEKNKLSGVAEGANNYVHPNQPVIIPYNIGGIVIQGVYVDNLAHVTSVVTVDLDNRYYTKDESKSLIFNNYYEPLTNGDVNNPELIFYNGDIVVGRVV